MSSWPLLASARLPDMPWLMPALRIGAPIAVALGTCLYFVVQVALAYVVSLAFRTSNRRRLAASVIRAVFAVVLVWAAGAGVYWSTMGDEAAGSLAMLVSIPVAVIVLQTAAAVVLFRFVDVGPDPAAVWKVVVGSLGLALVSYFVIDGACIVAAALVIGLAVASL